MNSNTPTTINTIDYAVHLLILLPDALLHATSPLGDVQQRIAELEGRTCSGNAHWRDKENANKTPKLYILHGTDQACPIHGKPEPGQRLRVYIGNKPDKIADALAAMERDTERWDLERDRRRFQEMIDRTIYKLKDLYRAFDYSIPAPGPTTSPVLDKDGQIVTE